MNDYTTTTVCGNCGTAEQRRLLHHVRHRGIFRRLCTTCVLRLHPHSFCPTCFLIYDLSPTPSNDTVSCFKCYSSSHSRCVSPNPPKPYICPLCANPNLPIFTLKKVEDEVGKGGDGNCQEIDLKAAKVLLVAARIAAASMSKAAVTARAEAERRVKEAAFTRKRAREALEHVGFLFAKDKLIHKCGNNNNNNASSVGVVKVEAVKNRIGNQGLDCANEVSARLNAVGLRENERLQRFGRQSNNCASMAVESNEKLRLNPASKNDRPGNLDHLGNNIAHGEKVNHGLYSVPSVGAELQHMQNNRGREENIGSNQ
ncbi:hypothetical protein ACSBR2_003927 [Camellia fascicularis]